MSTSEPEKWPEVDPTPDVGEVEDLNKVARHSTDNVSGDEVESERSRTGDDLHSAASEVEQ